MICMRLNSSTMGAPKTNTASVPPPLTLASAIAASDSLTSLASRLAESQRRFDAIAALLPEGLARELRPGPVDDEGWSLLASNAAVAAKLRHLLPRLTAELRSRSFRDLPIRVHLRAY
jgi:Dna[CI] antecedent, DciA